MALGPILPMMMVYPSAGLLMRACVPIIAAAPALMSTTIFCPNSRPRGSAIVRAAISVVPPAAAGTIIRIGLLG